MITTLQIVLLVAIVILCAVIVGAHHLSVRKAERELAASRRDKR